MPAQSTSVAVIGVGIMGSAIARNLIASGFAVSGFDTDPARLSELTAIGGVPAGSAAEAARDAADRTDQPAERRGAGGHGREPRGGADSGSNRRRTQHLSASGEAHGARPAGARPE